MAKKYKDFVKEKFNVANGANVVAKGVVSGFITSVLSKSTLGGAFAFSAGITMGFGVVDLLGVPATKYMEYKKDRGQRLEHLKKYREEGHTYSHARLHAPITFYTLNHPL